MILKRIIKYNYIVEITIEYVLIDNLVINFLILFLSAVILKARVSKWRCFSGAIIGAVCSLLTPLISLPNYLFIIYKMLLGYIMVRIALKPVGFAKNVISYFVFLLMTAVMGGVCFGIVYLLSGEINQGFVLVYNTEIPVGIVVLVISLISYGVYKIVGVLNRKKLFNTFIFKAELKNLNKTTEFEVYLDSGNTLKDPLSNKPIIIIEYSVFKKIFDLPLDKLLTKKIDEKDIEGSHYIDYGTVGGNGKMLVFEADQLLIKDDKKQIIIPNPSVGLTFSKLTKCFDCEALIGPEIAKEFIDWKH